MDRTKKVKEKYSGDDTIPGHLPQAWRKPRGALIPDTQFSFGGVEEGGGDKVEAIRSLRTKRLSNLRMTLHREAMCSICRIFTRVRYLFCM